MVKRKRLTVKQRKFIKEYVRTGNGVKSALKVYDTDNYGSANTIAHENLQKLINSPDMISAYEKVGITGEYLAKLTKQELGAKETKFFAEKGIVKTEKNVIAHDIRIKALDITHKVRGDYKPEKHEITAELTFEYFKSLNEKYSKKK